MPRTVAPSGAPPPWTIISIGHNIIVKPRNGGMEVDTDPAEFTEIMVVPPARGDNDSPICEAKLFRSRGE
jgi:hypothetical protein